MKRKVQNKGNAHPITPHAPKERLPGQSAGTGSIVVYRGTSLTEELRMWRESDGYIYSEAARDGYHTCIYDGYGFEDALLTGAALSMTVLVSQIEIWGSAENYAQSHSLFGTELARAFGPRPAVSWTTDVNTAFQFAGRDGYVLVANVRTSAVMNSDPGENDEGEVLVVEPLHAESLAR